MSFFFQAEDGIRDGHVTGVQTCALPIYAATQHKLDTYIAQEADIDEPSEEELRQQYDEIVEQQSQAASDGGGEGAGEQAEVPPFEEVRDQLAEEATAEQENEAANEIVTEDRKSTRLNS